MEIFGWLIAIILIAVVGAGFWGIGAYNGFVRQRNMIQESWRQVDVELNRRYELIPNLVETVRAFAGHERNTLEEVTRLRSQAQQMAGHGGVGAPSAERAQIEEQLSGAVRNLLVSVEAYPELKSNQNFLELQRQLTETEDRIASGRRYYNANVRNYNTRVESVPSNVIANMFKFVKATYFEVNDAQVRRAPDVNFGEISYRGDAPRPQVQAPPPAASDPNALPNPQAPGGYNPPPQQGFPPQQYPPQQTPPQQYPPQQGGYNPPQQPGGYNPPQ